jgi:hypothetical protein
MSSSGISSVSSGQGPGASGSLEQLKQTREAALSGAGQALGESEDDLKKDLASGKSLADIAKDKGVSTDDLQKSMEDAVKKANPSMSDDQAGRITQKMISGHHHHHHAAAAPAPAPTPAPDTSTTDAPPPPPGSIISVKV